MIGKESKAVKTGTDEVIHAELKIDEDWYDTLKNLYPCETKELISIIAGLRSAGMFNDVVDENKIEKDERYFIELKWRGLGAIKRDIEMLRRELLRKETVEDELGVTIEKSSAQE